MTKQQARLNIIEQIKAHLHINLADYYVFCEQQQGKAYSIVLLSHNAKHCILANCDDINNPNAMVKIIQF